MITPLWFRRKLVHVDCSPATARDIVYTHRRPSSTRCMRGTAMVAQPAAPTAPPSSLSPARSAGWVSVPAPPTARSVRSFPLLWVGPWPVPQWATAPALCALTSADPRGRLLRPPSWVLDWLAAAPWAWDRAAAARPVRLWLRWTDTATLSSEESSATCCSTPSCPATTTTACSTPAVASTAWSTASTRTTTVCTTATRTTAAHSKTTCSACLRTATPPPAG
mmetsp:Transcript_62542/g.110357  ORF Transcript_62542/g.110357 Transcript_62542/m.110357 type:complete len:222 (+) Transcript_62542:71-736(+)